MTVTKSRSPVVVYIVITDHIISRVIIVSGSTDHWTDRPVPAWAIVLRLSEKAPAAAGVQLILQTPLKHPYFGLTTGLGGIRQRAYLSPGGLGCTKDSTKDIYFKHV